MKQARESENGKKADFGGKEPNRKHVKGSGMLSITSEGLQSVFGLAKGCGSGLLGLKGSDRWRWVD